MSATHDAPPPIPPKPDRPDSQGRPQNENDINQLLNLIDEELNISQEAYWNQPTNTTPSNVLPSPSMEPVNISHSSRLGSETPSSNITNLTRRSSGASTSSSRSQQVSYNVPSPVNSHQHSYNAHQYYNHAQQQPYNYGGAQYYTQANVPYNYYSNFPRDLTSQGWPPAHNTPHSNPSMRPLPNPPMPNTNYQSPLPYNSAYNTPYNYGDYGGNYTPSPATSAPRYSTQLVMPDFHYYKTSGPPHLPQQNELQSQTQKSIQVSYI
jgi:hypothetical protein